MKIDLKVLGEELATVVKGHLQAFARRLDAIEQRQPIPGERGEKGEPGTNGRDGAPGERGEKGEPGTNGRDGAPGERGEKGEPGTNGRDGAPGERGEKGEPGANGRDGAPGERGEKGDPGRDGKDGAPGEAGQKGADGTSVTVDQVLPLLEAHVSKWMLDWERRAHDALTKAVDRLPVPKDGAPGRDGRDGEPGKDGAAGQDGRDGFSPDDLQVEIEGRLLTVTLACGDRIVKRQIVLAGMPIYQEIYKSNRLYVANDMVTYGGGIWRAKRDTTEPPKGPSDDWHLVVKGGK